MIKRVETAIPPFEEQCSIVDDLDLLIMQVNSLRRLQVESQQGFLLELLMIGYPPHLKILIVAARHHMPMPTEYLLLVSSVR
jgi:hypothetical protein